jgi:short-subunit dehydrogenase
MFIETILKNKNCFISGATGSLGECFSKRFAKEGCNLFLTSTNNSKLEKLKKNIENSLSSKVKIFYAPGDFEDIASINNVLKIAKETIGDIDILINSIGIVQFKPFINTTIEDFDKMFNLNVRAPFILCKELCKDMIKKKWGRILNIGSTTSYSSISIAPLYSSSKHAILGLTRAIYQDLGKNNVQVFCISPGPLKSEMGKKVVKKFKENWESFIDPEEVADYAAHAIKFDENMISEEIRLNRIQENF